MMSFARDLLHAFDQRNLGKFQEALEVFQVNPNDFDEPTSNRSVFETILSTPNTADFIRLCLNNNADFYMKNNNGQYPLHCVIESESLENLAQVEQLFDDVNLTTEIEIRQYSSIANVKQSHGENALHLLAMKINNENFENIFEMMKVFIKHGCNSNYPNYDGKTAFFILLEGIPKLKKRKEILDYFLKYADVDFYSHRSEEIIEMVMNQKLKYEIPEKEELNVDLEAMLKILENYQINKFETLFPFFKATCSDTECYQDCCSMFMEIAVKNSIINIVDLLIDYGIDVNRIPKMTKLNIPPAFQACSNAKPSLLRLFLMHPKIKLTYEDENGRKTLLHQFFEERKRLTYSAFRRSDSREMTEDQKKCFDLLMAHPKCNRHLINAHDENSLTAIYYAVKYKNDYVTLQLLRNGAYIGTVINGIRRSLLEEFLNSTITTNDRFYDDEELEIKIDYTFLSPPCKYQTLKRRGAKKLAKISQTEISIGKSNSETDKILTCDSHEQYAEEVKPLQKLTENPELRHLVAHPTIASFILLKWNKISFLVYINMIIILTFILSFIPFAYLCQTLPEGEKSSNFFYIFLQITSLLSLSCLIIREVTQAMLSVRNYVFNYSNWIDICLMVFATTILVFESQLPNHLSRMLRTIVILLATAEYFNLLGMLPILSISIHTKMFKKVCLTFIKSLSFYSMLIIAFAFSFYNLHGDKFIKDIHKLNSEGPDTSTNDIPVTNATRNERFNNFYTVGSAIIKSFVMLTGELETSYVHTEGWTYAILFLMFLFLVTIVLYNLLNAMAVSDTQEIKRDAKIIDLNQRIETMHESEEAIFQRTSRMGNWLKMVISMFPKTIPEGYVILKPNRSYRIYIKQNDVIILNEWLPDRLKCLKQDVKFNQEVLQDLQNLLKTQREDQKIADIRRLKESRNEKLANDIINVCEKIGSIQKNIAKLQSDLFAIQKRINL